MLDPERQRKLEELFHLAVDLPPAERPSFFERHCAEDAELYRELEELLAADHRATTDPVRAPPDADHGNGRRIGRYRILELLGEGGMGLVYLAEQQEPVRRKVALKIVKAGMDTERVIARFEAERQALALMDHPHIARVLDGGATETGRPYFVMEHVSGLPITDYCDRAALSIEQRVRLFRDVCDAVQHAHQKGVIHRDLKPSNVLVAEQDGRLSPRIIDFGIARAVSHPLTDRTLHTRADEVIGTFDYMSPEQADRGAYDVDTRTDIYSLGVLLYELLTGALPFATDTLQQKPLADVQRILREREPQKPSTRVTRLGDDRAELARRRSTDPGAWPRRLHGDLDWITMKAIEKDRARRYPSASELASDLDRHLRHEPVSAGRPGAATKIRKFVRRNRVAVIAGTSVVVALLAGLGGTAWGWLAARTGRVEAESQRRRADANSDALRRQLYASRMLLAQAAVDRDEFDRAEQLLDQTPADLRGFEWNYLRGAGRRCLAETLHDVAFTDLEFDLASATFWTADETGMLQAWDASGLRAGPGRKVHDGKFRLALARAGDRFVTSAYDGSIKVWPREGEPIRTLRTALPALDDVVISDDGALVACSSGGQVVQVFDVVSGAERFRHQANLESEFHSVALRPDAGTLAAAGAELWVWDLASRTVLHTETLAADARGLAFHPSSDLLSFGLGSRGGGERGVDRAVELRDTRTWRPAGRFGGHRGAVFTTAWTADGRALASCAGDSTLRIWDPTSGDSIVLRGHRTPAGLVAVGRDGAYASAAGRELRIWDTAVRSEAWTIHHRGIRHGAFAISPDGRWFVTDNYDGPALAIWDAATGMPLRMLRGHASAVCSVAVFGDGSKIVSGQTDGSLRVVDAADGALRFEAAAHRGRVGHLRVGEQERWVVTIGPDGKVRTWSLADGAAIATHEIKGASPTAVTAGPGALFVGTSDGRILVLDAPHCTLRQTWDAGGADVVGIALSSRGHVVAATHGGVVRAFDPANGQLLLTFTEPSVHLCNLAVSADGRRFASSSTKGVLRVWDADTGEGVLALPMLATTATALAFMPDAGTVVAVVPPMGMVQLVESGRPSLEVARERERVRLARAIVARLRNDLVLTDDVVAAVRADPALAPELREACARAALALGDDPAGLNELSWGIVKHAGRRAADYARAVRMARRACELLPGSASVLNTLGVAQFRAGDFAAALATLRESDRRHRTARGASLPHDIAFLALAEQSLGNGEAAQRHRDLMRRLMGDPEHLNDQDAVLFAREVEATLGSR